MPIKVIIDTDTGIDDAMGCVLALRSPELDVLAFTTVFGNVDVGLVTENTAYLLEVMQRSDVPLARGAGAGLVGTPSFAPYVHGDDGVGNAGFPQPTQVRPVEASAAQLIIETCHQHPGERLRPCRSRRTLHRWGHNPLRPDEAAYRAPRSPDRYHRD